MSSESMISGQNWDNIVPFFCVGLLAEYACIINATQLYCNIMVWIMNLYTYM